MALVLASLSGTGVVPGSSMRSGYTAGQESSSGTAGGAAGRAQAFWRGAVAAGIVPWEYSRKVPLVETLPSPGAGPGCSRTQPEPEPWPWPATEAAVVAVGECSRRAMVPERKPWKDFRVSQAAVRRSRMGLASSRGGPELATWCGPHQSEETSCDGMAGAATSTVVLGPER